jgi:hypothetical protein
MPVLLDTAHGTFTARVLVPSDTVFGDARREFSGRHAIRCGLVITAVAVPAAHGPRSSV